MADITDDYASGQLFPLDLKNSLASWLIEKLKPARDYFDKQENRKALVKMKRLMGIE